MRPSRRRRLPLPDQLLHLGGSLVQHGPSSDRVYVMKMATDDVELVLNGAAALAARHGYGKIIVKARASDFGELTRRGYVVEAVVPQFHEHREAVLFAGKFLEKARSADPRAPRVGEVLEAARAARMEALAGIGPAEEPVGPVDIPPLPEAMSDGAPAPKAEGLEVRPARSEDIGELARCYAEVFDSYPFPIHDPSHLRAEQERGTRYFGVWENGRLVAASAMEPGGAPSAVEMTDFATLPSHRKRGMATHLLGVMDSLAREAGLRVAYTIARACSYGMNITFGRRGYRYAGTLVNNTQIAGAIESMNVWYKLLEDHS
jgi:putative beta-lysine N-acetyltransferase